MDALTGLRHFGIGNELVQFRDSILVDVDQGIESVHDTHQLEKEQVPRMPLPDVHQLVPDDVFMVTGNDLIAQKMDLKKEKAIWLSAMTMRVNSLK